MLIKEKWIKRNNKLGPEEASQIAKKWGISKEIVQIAANRGVTDFDEYFGPGNIHDSNMLDMEKAVHLLLEALSEGKNIRIMGDYDMDGSATCSSTSLER